MENVLMEAVGTNGQLELLETKIRIRRKGLVALIHHGLKGDKEILLSSITSIRFQPAGVLNPGYIHFSFQGGQELHGVGAATRDENAVLFKRRHQDAFEAIKSEIEKTMIAIADSTSPRYQSNLDEIAKLADLRDRGIVTQDEFDAKKKQILDL